MMIPIRVEYLANPIYGINASNAQISMLLISVVLLFRVISTKFWGLLFDSVNVVNLRIILNTVFAASICSFFFTTNIWLIGFGCALLGTGFGGGGILWTLYVTKIAPPDKVASYMSVHGFLTGVRMAAAPFIGYTIVQYTHPAFAAWVALVLIGISIILFLPLRPLIDAKAGELETYPTSRPDSA
jgi:predicted MFS family arabinose efflux permease